ncbi:hypothetical protein ACTFIU_006383 [Dictyostelium citrinum]
MNSSALNLIQFLESSKIQVPGGLKSVKGILDFDFYDLVKNIGESTSREEEVHIIQNEIVKLKSSFSKDQTKDKKRECLIRMIYCHMLGYDVPFGHIQALNMTQDSEILNKRTGYLTLSLCLPEKHELLIMAVNSILKGLNSSNYLEVCSALTAMCKLIDNDTIPAFLQKVLQLLNHQKPIVRKKSVTVLHRFYRLIGDSFLDDDQIIDKLRQSLCDRDPSVMAASICIFLDISEKHSTLKDNNNNNKINNNNNNKNLKKNNEEMNRSKNLIIILKELVPSFVGILKQVAEGRLPNSYIYHGIHHPWLQINLLKLLSNLGYQDKDTSNHMYTVLLFTMQQSQKFKNNVGFAILYETIKTLTLIHPNLQLIEQCSKNIAIFLKGKHHNLRYFGIKALASIVKVSPKLVLPYQVEVIESLESPDETLKRKSFDLLYRMTNQTNVVPVCSKLIEQLVLSKDQNFKSELISQITNIAEKYSPNDIWYIDTISTVLSILPNENQKDSNNNSNNSNNYQFAYNLIRLVSEEDDIKVKQHISEIYLNNIMISNEQQQQQQQNQNNLQQFSDIYIKIMSWVVSEYSNLIVSNNGVIESDIISYLCDLLEKDYQGDTKSWIIIGIGKLVAQLGKSLPMLELMTKKFKSSKSLICQQRSSELNEILKNPKSMSLILPLDAYCEDIDFNKIFNKFNDYSNKVGGKQYIPYEKRKNTPLVDISDGTSSSHSHSNEKGLNFQYPPPPDPFNPHHNQQQLYPVHQNQPPSHHHQQQPPQQQQHQLFPQQLPQQQLLLLGEDDTININNNNSLVPVNNDQQLQQLNQNPQYQQQPPQNPQYPNNQLITVPDQTAPKPIGLPKPSKVLWTKKGFVGNKQTSPQNAAPQLQQTQNTTPQHQTQNTTPQQHQKLQQQTHNNIDPEKEKLAKQLFGGFSENNNKNENNNSSNNNHNNVGISSKLQHKKSNNENNNSSNNNNNKKESYLEELIDLSPNLISNINITNNSNNNNINNNNSLLVDLEGDGQKEVKNSSSGNPELINLNLDENTTKNINGNLLRNDLEELNKN